MPLLPFSSAPGATVSAGTGLTKSGNTLSITNTAVSAGSYTSANITVNAQGQLTAASDGSGGGGGQTLYDIIVAASGGTYTTLTAALAAATTGQTIFVRNGTYAESSGGTTSTNGIAIVGESASGVNLTLSAAYTLSGTGVIIRNCGFTDSGASGSLTLSGAGLLMDACQITFTTGTFTVSGSDATTVINSTFTGSGRSDTAADYILLSNTNGLFRGNYVSIVANTTNYPVHLAATSLIVSGNTFEVTTGSHQNVVYGDLSYNYLNVTGNNFIGVGSERMLYVGGEGSVISGNTFTNPTFANGTAIYGDESVGNFEGCVVSGNQITGFQYGVYLNSVISCAITGNSLLTNVYGIYSSSSIRNTISSNSIFVNRQTSGIYLAGSDSANVINGNAIFQNSTNGITLGASTSGNLVTSNYTNGSGGLVDSGSGNTKANNI